MKIKPKIYILVLILCVSLSVSADEPFLQKDDLFLAETDGYAHYRIPGIVVTPQGSVIVYCEARKSTKGDWGTINIFMRRSTDGGNTFDPPRNIAIAPEGVGQNPIAVEQGLSSADSITMNNPVMIADHETGALHFLYCIGYARCFYMRSGDDGLTFSESVEITSTFDRFRPEYDWKVIATGPGHGIQLRNGRLIVPVWLSTGTGGHAHRPSCVSVIYSDDQGKTWQRGEIVANHPDPLKNPSETVAVQLSDGRVLLNMRNESDEHRRAVSYSDDGATGWTIPKFQDDLFEPICMGSMIAISQSPERQILLFANPDNGYEQHKQGGIRDRRNLTIKRSDDDGQSWPIQKLLEDGISGYSDLAVGTDGTIYCFYERGRSENHYAIESLMLARFNLEWLKM